jgi:hypothetical protein
VELYLYSSTHLNGTHRDNFTFIFTFAFLYMYGTSTLTLREGCGLKEFENIKKVNKDWRKLHDQELYDLYPSPNVNRVTK